MGWRGEDMKQFLGIDIGGTNIKVGVVSRRGEVIARGLLETLPAEGPVRARTSTP